VIGVRASGPRLRHYVRRFHVRLQTLSAWSRYGGCIITTAMYNATHVLSALIVSPTAITELLGTIAHVIAGIRKCSLCTD